MRIGEFAYSWFAWRDISEWAEHSQANLPGLNIKWTKVKSLMQMRKVPELSFDMEPRYSLCWVSIILHLYLMSNIFYDCVFDSNALSLVVVQKEYLNYVIYLPNYIPNLYTWSKSDNKHKTTQTSMGPANYFIQRRYKLGN